MNTTTTTTTITLIEETWSFRQKALLGIVARTTSSLSILGSLYIIWHNLKSDSGRNTRLRHVYNRVVMALSFCDLMVSGSGFVSTWAIPADDTQSFYVFNKGNEQTCNAQGFFAQMGVGVALYNASLSLYFLLSTRYKIPNDKLAKKIEPFFHIISLGFPFITGLYATLQGYMNPTPTLCWIAEKPRGCKGDECIRGEDYIKLRLYFVLLPIILCIIVIIVSMVMIYTHVRKLENAVHSYSRRWTRKLSGRQSKRVFRQAMFYIGAFCCVWLPLIAQFCIVKVFAGDSKIQFYSLLSAQIFVSGSFFCNEMYYSMIFCFSVKQ